MYRKLFPTHTTAVTHLCVIDDARFITSARDGTLKVFMMIYSTIHDDDTSKHVYIYLYLYLYIYTKNACLATHYVYSIHE
jgi:hypothetical protein